jgi:hypothetical protein
MTNGREGNAMSCTHFPSLEQNDRYTGLPLRVSRSSYTFNVPSRSSIVTLLFSMMRFEATYEPATLRQLAQWQRWPRLRVNSSRSFMVTVMLPHRQEPDMDSLNLDTSWSFGSPVRALGWLVPMVLCTRAVGRNCLIAGVRRAVPDEIE